MRDWLVGASALLSAGAEQTEVRPGWSVHPLPAGAELRFVPLAVSLKDYPKQARRAGDEGTALLNLQVDASGHLIGCSIAQSSGSPVLDEQACQLYYQRGRFELRGTQGPVTVQAPVRWVLID